MTTFNSDVLDRVSVAIDLTNARAEGVLPGKARARPGWIFDRHGYQPPIADTDWERLAALSEKVATLLGMIANDEHDTAIEHVNQWLEDRRTTPYVERRADGWVLHFHTPDATFTQGWAGGIAAALALSYSTGDADRIGRCAATGCARFFMDRGRNQQRRFCSLRCQNRAKSASYRQRGPTGDRRGSSEPGSVLQ